MKKIAIYQDYVHNNGSLVMSLQDVGAEFIFVDAKQICDGVLDLVKISTLIMPGGADLYYCEKLNGEGNTNIRSFVEAGGGYLGICAGAYYGCSTLGWNNGEIAGGRELALIDVAAIGPVFSFIEDGDIKKSWYAAVRLKTAGGEFIGLYAAGPVFEKPGDDVEVLARYADLDDAPAIIGKSIGNGYVVLSSPHIEVSAESFSAGRYSHASPHAAHEKKVAQELHGHLEKQRAFFKSLLQKTGWE